MKVTFWIIDLPVSLDFGQGTNTVFNEVKNTHPFSALKEQPVYFIVRLND